MTATAQASSRKGTVSRRLLPFVPVALGVLAQSGVVGSGGGTAATQSAPGPNDTKPAVCGDDITDFHVCHSDYPTGCSAKAGYDGYLNYLKNQLVDPARTPEGKPMTPADFIGLDGNLPSGLAKNNHEQFKTDMDKLGEGKVVVLTGYLYYAKKGGAESSNCGLVDPEDIDYHIGIGPESDLVAKLASGKALSGPDKKTMDTTSVVVEMTPHWRAQFKPAWNLPLVQGVVGRQVRIFGQLLADNEHADPKDDCAFQGHSDRCWRASVWELHPVTRFEVCTADSCDPAGDDAWADLEATAEAGAGGGAAAAGAVSGGSVSSGSPAGSAAGAAGAGAGGKGSRSGGKSAGGKNPASSNPAS
jgi:hypothetical protein